MTVETITTSRPLRTLRVGVALAVLVAVVDVGGMLAFGLPSAPVTVNVITTLLFTATIVGAAWAWRDKTWGVWVVAISRALSALSVVPILFVPEAPKEAIPMSVVVAVVSIIAIVLLFVGHTKRP